MKKMTERRAISFILALVLMFSLVPAVFAEGAEDEAEIIVTEEPAAEPEAPAEEPEAPAAEEPGEPEAEPEEPQTEEPAAEETAEEEPAAEETEEAVPVKVSFVYPGEFAIALPADASYTRAVCSEENGVWSLDFFLSPGEYSWRAEAVGCYDSAVQSLVIEENSADLAISPELEAYPAGIRGMGLDFVPSAQDIEAGNAVKSHDVAGSLGSMTAGVDYVAGELLVSASNEAEAAEAARAYGAELVSFSGGIAVVELQNGLTVPETFALSLSGEIRLPFAEPNFIARPGDPASCGSSSADGASAMAAASNGSWKTWRESKGSFADPFLANPASGLYQYQHDVMNTYEAWSVTTGSPAIKLCILDSGVTAGHEDLVYSGTWYDDRQTDSYDKNLGSANDATGHGTHCAGIAAAQMGNGKGGAGVAPGVSLYGYRIMDNVGAGTASVARIIRGINKAAGDDMDIISMSFSTFGYSYFEEKAIESAVRSGSTVVAAAGNDGSNIRCYPGAYSIPGVICVGSTNRAGAVSGFSNTGCQVDVYAPGSDINSTYNNGAYELCSGTSMATPAVSGVCALYMSLYGHKQVSPAKMESVIRSSTNGGVIDAWKVVSKAAKTAAPNTALTVNAPATLMSGESVQLTATGSDGAQIKGTIYWTVTCTDCSVCGFASVSEKGVLTADNSGNIAVLVTACTPDGATGSATVSLQAPSTAKYYEQLPVTSILFRANYVPSSEGARPVEYDKNNCLKTITLFVSDFVDTAAVQENVATIQAYLYNNVSLTGGDVFWTSSKPSVAAVDQNGRVTAVSKGSAVITCASAANPKIKASVKVTVTVPASYISIKSGMTNMGKLDGFNLAAGKSASNKAVLGDTYGKPTDTKVAWSAVMYACNSDTDAVVDTFYPAKNAKLGYFNISSSGKLTVFKSIMDRYDFYKGTNYYKVVVTATANAGTAAELSSTIEYLIGAPATKLFIKYTSDRYWYTSYKCKLSSYSGAYAFNVEPDCEYKGNFYNFYTNSLKAESSNPSVAGGYIENGYLYVFTGKPGTATITVKTTDGTNKTVKLTVTVKK